LIALLSLLLLLSVSLLIMRVGTVALTPTGLTRESAQFQAHSRRRVYHPQVVARHRPSCTPSHHQVAFFVRLTEPLRCSIG
jgi:hypothetical protein